MEEDIKASLVEFVQYDHDTGEKTLVSDMGDTTPPQCAQPPEPTSR